MSDIIHYNREPPKLIARKRKKPQDPWPLRLSGRRHPYRGGGRVQATFFSSKNCSSSVEPCSAVVELWFCWIVWVTASK